jgi:DnaJ-class molecular chaperone
MGESKSGLYRDCPDCGGSGRGPHNPGTWCEKCRQYEHGYYPKCATCKGDGIVAVREEKRLTLPQVLRYLHSDDLRDLGLEALIRRAFDEEPK